MYSMYCTVKRETRKQKYRIAIGTTKGHKMVPIMSTKKMNSLHVITNSKIGNQGQEKTNIYTRLKLWTKHNEAQSR